MKKQSFAEAVDHLFNVDEVEEHDPILDQLPQDERSFVRTYFRNPALQAASQAVMPGIVVKYATPKRVYRIFKGSKLIGYMDWRSNVLKKWDPKQWDEPRDEDMTRSQKTTLAQSIIKLKK